jgi:preprotein translocase subunit SecE
MAVSPIVFFRQVRQEVSKVAWPSRKETAVTTVMVFLMVGLASLFFMVVDWVLSYGAGHLLGLGG